MDRSNMTKQVKAASPRRKANRAESVEAERAAVGMKKGGMVRSGIDGAAKRGKTKGKFC